MVIHAKNILISSSAYSLIIPCGPSAPRRPRTMTGRETFPALNFWTQLAARHYTIKARLVQKKVYGG